MLILLLSLLSTYHCFHLLYNPSAIVVVCFHLLSLSNCFHRCRINWSKNKQIVNGLKGLSRGWRLTRSIQSSQRERKVSYCHHTILSNSCYVASYSISTSVIKCDFYTTIFYGLNGAFLSAAPLLVLKALDPVFYATDWGLARHHRDHVQDLLQGGSQAVTQRFASWRVRQWAEPRYHWVPDCPH